MGIEKNCECIMIRKDLRQFQEYGTIHRPSRGRIKKFINENMNETKSKAAVILSYHTIYNLQINIIILIILIWRYIKL